MGDLEEINYAATSGLEGHDRIRGREELKGGRGGGGFGEVGSSPLSAPSTHPVGPVSPRLRLFTPAHFEPTGLVLRQL
ncbi:unnamed protein product [Mesocestoides corti]|uniref:Uncharacterized protein n=1 Tax=Mesocestoides corti TaxID=53468 RepID=A0A0R3UPV5_MESCO|nr:unnamed protein product [Mesocestoides corti]